MNTHLFTRPVRLSTARIALLVAVIAALAVVGVVALSMFVQQMAAQNRLSNRVKNHRSAMQALQLIHAAEQQHKARTGCFARLQELRLARALADDVAQDGAYVFVTINDCSRFVAVASPANEFGDRRTGDFWFSISDDGRMTAETTQSPLLLKGAIYEQ
jgi:hypothetical protein